MSSTDEKRFKNMFLEGIRHILECNQIGELKLNNNGDIYLVEEDERNVLLIRFENTLPYYFLARHSKKWEKSRIDINKLLILGVKEGLEYIGQRNEEIREPGIWLCVRCLHIVKRELKKNFVSQVSDIVHPNQFSGTALFMFLMSLSQRWNCTHVDIYGEVLTEAVKRGVAYIEDTGKEIYSPKAWLRRTSLNILKDKVKESVREEDKVEQVATLWSPKHKDKLSPELVEQLGYLDLAMKRLSKEDRRLIEMRFFESKQYDEIRYIYLSQDGKDISLVALRQRECRALKRLRQHFLVFYEGDLII